MKKLSLMTCVSLIGLLLGGCSGVAYNHQERMNEVARAWDLESRMIVDDVDMILMIRPVSQLSMWHIKAR